MKDQRTGNETQQHTPNNKKIKTNIKLKRNCETHQVIRMTQDSRLKTIKNPARTTRLMRDEKEQITAARTKHTKKRKCDTPCEYVPPF